MRDEVRPRCEGKTAMLFVGGSPGPSLPGPVRRDRHEDRGRRLRVRPPRRLRGPPGAARPSRSTPTAATSRSCTSRPTRSATGRARPPEEIAGRSRRTACTFKDYEGMMPGDGRRDARHRRHQPLRDRAADRDLTSRTCSAPASRRSTSIQKMGVPCKQLHSYDYGGPYAGFRGAINFYREIDRHGQHARSGSCMQGALAGKPPNSGSRPTCGNERSR